MIINSFYFPSEKVNAFELRILATMWWSLPGSFWITIQMHRSLCANLLGSLTMMQRKDATASLLSTGTSALLRWTRFAWVKAICMTFPTFVLAAGSNGF